VSMPKRSMGETSRSWTGGRSKTPMWIGLEGGMVGWGSESGLGWGRVGWWPDIYTNGAI